MTGSLATSTERIVEILRGFFTADQVALRDGFLQSRDPRITVLAIAGLAIAVVIARSFPVLIGLGLLTGLLAWRSAVPLRALIARSAIVPLFSAMIVLPQAVLLAGDPIASFGGLTVTTTGVMYILQFTLRVGLGVALLALLVTTTRISAILAALRALAVPATIVWVMAITYRYLFLFFEELRRLLYARNSRANPTTSLRAGWTDARRLAGSFLLRTLDRGVSVGRGMRARGGAHPPAPYATTRSLDGYDYGLLMLAALAIAGSGVVRWLA